MFVEGSVVCRVVVLFVVLFFEFWFELLVCGLLRTLGLAFGFVGCRLLI